MPRCDDDVMQVGQDVRRQGGQRAPLTSDERLDPSSSATTSSGVDFQVEEDSHGLDDTIPEFRDVERSEVPPETTASDRSYLVREDQRVVGESSVPSGYEDLGGIDPPARLQGGHGQDCQHGKGLVD